MWRLANRLWFVSGVCFGCVVAQSNGATCVWKVIGPNAHMLYLAGSFHALRPSDYPLPAAYDRAFDASSRLVFEEDPKTGAAAFRDLVKAGEYPKGDNLKNHVDPRTYQYLRKFFALRNVPEATYSRYRPWLLDILLSAPPPEYYELGIERFLMKRAQTKSKPITGLESSHEHNQVFAGLSDREAEMLLLVFFINAGRDDGGGVNMFDAWRHGDADLLASKLRESFRDFPTFGERIVGARNRRWIPKIENYLRSSDVYMVVAGAGHMGGPDGVLALLRQRGYKIEQL